MQNTTKGLGPLIRCFFLFAHCLCSGRYIPLPEEQRVWQICLLILDLVDIVALILLDHLEENAENREKLIAANERAHVQDENIQALSQAYVGQRKMTHDFRANLSTLSELLESERVDDAKEFLSELNVRQSERILLVNSHNAAIDAVLNQKGYIGKKQGIDMRFRVNDLSALRLPRVDVIIVLGNLIDNAMEACAGLSDPNRWGQYSDPLQREYAFYFNYQSQ